MIFTGSCANAVDGTPNAASNASTSRRVTPPLVGALVGVDSRVTSRWEDMRSFAISTPLLKLHLTEQMNVCVAHRQRLLALLQLHRHPPAHIALHVRDGVDIDYRGAVNLPENLRVELVRKFL